MNTIELISNRRSFRTFDGRRLKAEDLEDLNAYIATVDNPYHIGIEWFFLSMEENRLTVPVITGADTYIAGKLKKGPHSEEAFGFSFEKIVLYALSKGIGTTWIAGTMKREGFEEAIALKDDELMPCISPLGYPANKMSFRETMMRKGVKADTRLDPSELFFDKSINTPFNMESRPELKDALQMVRLAPSAVNKQPWRLIIEDNAVHFYEKSAKGYRSDTMDLQKVDLGIAMCHFEMVMRENGHHLKFETEEPDIVKPEGLYYIATYRF